MLLGHCTDNTVYRGTGWVWWIDWPKGLPGRRQFWWAAGRHWVNEGWWSAWASLPPRPICTTWLSAARHGAGGERVLKKHDRTGTERTETSEIALSMLWLPFLLIFGTLLIYQLQMCPSSLSQKLWFTMSKVENLLLPLSDNQQQTAHM